MNKNITPVECSYFAALVDGEGSITISKSRSKTGRLQYSPRLTIAMNDIQAIKFMQQFFGGKIRIGKKKIHLETGEEYAPARIIEYGAAEDLRCILSNIRPYSRVKSKQIDVLLEFLDFKEKNHDSTFRRNGIYNNYYTKLKALKHRFWVK